MIHDDSSDMVPDGAAIFPLIPEELGVDPMLLAVLHSVVFLVGSDEEVVHSAAAEESLQYIMTYLTRLQGPQRKKFREDLAVLIAFAKDDQWPKQDILFLKSLSKEIGASPQSES